VTFNSFGRVWNEPAAPAADYNMNLHVPCGLAVIATNCAHVTLNHNGKMYVAWTSGLLIMRNFTTHSVAVLI
jgi:hypothetical protein